MSKSPSLSSKQEIERLSKSLLEFEDSPESTAIYDLHLIPMIDRELHEQFQEYSNLAKKICNSLEKCGNYGKKIIFYIIDDSVLNQVLQIFKYSDKRYTKKELCFLKYFLFNEIQHINNASRFEKLRRKI